MCQTCFSPEDVVEFNQTDPKYLFYRKEYGPGPFIVARTEPVPQEVLADGGTHQFVHLKRDVRTDPESWLWRKTRILAAKLRLVARKN